MNHKLKLIISVACFTFASTAAANADCRQAYFGDFVHRPGHKAIAITGGRPFTADNISCGNAWDAKTIASAKIDAIKACRVSDRKYHDKGVCTVVYAK